MNASWSHSNFLLSCFLNSESLSSRSILLSLFFKFLVIYSSWSHSNFLLSSFLNSESLSSRTILLFLFLKFLVIDSSRSHSNLFLLFLWHYLLDWSWGSLLLLLKITVSFTVFAQGRFFNFLIFKAFNLWQDLLSAILSVLKTFKFLLNGSFVVEFIDQLAEVLLAFTNLLFSIGQFLLADLIKLSILLHSLVFFLGDIKLFFSHNWQIQGWLELSQVVGLTTQFNLRGSLVETLLKVQCWDWRIELLWLH